MKGQQALTQWLKEPAQEALNQDFVVWIKRVILAQYDSHLLDNQTLKAIQDLEEMSTMLSETIERWKKEWREEATREGLEEGKQQGMQEGKLEGMHQGEVTVLLRLLELKFGPVTDHMRQRIMAADSDTILTWSERILTAQTPEEVVG